MINGNLEQVRVKVMAILDEHSISDEEALSLSDMLYAAAHFDETGCLKRLPPLSFRPSDNPNASTLSMAKWGLDPSLIDEDN